MANKGYALSCGIRALEAPSTASECGELEKKIKSLILKGTETIFPTGLRRRLNLGQMVTGELIKR